MRHLADNDPKDAKDFWEKLLKELKSYPSAKRQAINKPRSDSLLKHEAFIRREKTQDDSLIRKQHSDYIQEQKAKQKEEYWNQHSRHSKASPPPQHKVPELRPSNTPEHMQFPWGKQIPTVADQERVATGAEPTTTPPR